MPGDINKLTTPKWHFSAAFSVAPWEQQLALLSAGPNCRFININHIHGPARWEEVAVSQVGTDEGSEVSTGGFR